MGIVDLPSRMRARPQRGHVEDGEDDIRRTSVVQPEPSRRVTSLLASFHSQSPTGSGHPIQGNGMGHTVTPTDAEVLFDKDDIIVSKTDLKGRITYANQTFCQIAGCSEAELMGQPHSIIRHPDMPRAVFKLLWDTLLEGREVFAYVKNMAKSGNYYWVFAHVTPSFDQNKRIIGFHSSRRVPDPETIKTAITPIY